MNRRSVFKNIAALVIGGPSIAKAVSQNKTSGGLIEYCDSQWQTVEVSFSEPVVMIREFKFNGDFVKWHSRYNNGVDWKFEMKPAQ